MEKAPSSISRGPSALSWQQQLAVTRALQQRLAAAHAAGNVLKARLAGKRRALATVRNCMLERYMGLGTTSSSGSGSGSGFGSGSVESGWKWGGISTQSQAPHIVTLPDLVKDLVLLYNKSEKDVAKQKQQRGHTMAMAAGAASRRTGDAGWLSSC